LKFKFFYFKGQAMRTLCFLLAVFLTSNIYSALQEGTAISAGNDLGKEKSPEVQRNWKATLLLEDFTQEFLISTQEGRANISSNEQRVQYNPSVTTVVGARLEWQNIGWTFKTKLLEDDEEYISERGKSEFYDFAFDIALGAHNIGVYYRGFEGFYADLNASSGFAINTDNTQTTTRDNSEPLEPNIIKRPDLVSNNFGGSYVLKGDIFHPYKENTLNHLADNEEILRGLILDASIGAQYDYFSFYGTEKFIPDEYEGSLSNSTLSRITSHAVGGKLGVGLGYYFSPKFMMRTEIMAGGALSLQRLTSEGGTRSDFVTSNLFDFELVAKYEGSRSVFAMAFDVKIVGGKTSEDVYFDSNARRFTISYGLKFL
jgi:hypothetical protein